MHQLKKRDQRHFRRSYKVQPIGGSPWRHKLAVRSEISPGSDRTLHPTSDVTVTGYAFVRYLNEASRTRSSPTVPEKVERRHSKV